MYLYWLLLSALHLQLAVGFDWPWEDNSSSSSSASATSSSSSPSSSSSSSGGSFFSDVGSIIGGGDDKRDGYEPYSVTCPSESLVREATNISQSESDYILARHEQTNEKLIDFLSNKANLSDFNAKEFIENYSKDHNISIGLAFSGGGYRAMLTGAGQLLALDDRYDTAKSDGLGGLLQSASYLAGLSGGNWLVGTVVLNDWLSIADILKEDSGIWDLEDSIFNPNGLNLVKTMKYYNGISSSLSAKSDAGYDLTVTDLWGRALSYQFFNDSNGGQNITWSSIRDLQSFKDHDMPYPVVVANGRTPGIEIINENSTVFEISPYELGSWDPSLQSFSDVKYIGTFLNKGDSNNSKSCINNFDNAGFIMGTSSSLFNQIVLRLEGTNLNSALKALLSSILRKVSQEEVDIASYNPNPFLHVDHAEVESIVSNDTLYLVDGGEDLQNVPFYPLIQTARKLDVIFGFDNSADTDDNWPNGTSIGMTYRRQFVDQGKGTPFPYVPTVEEFLKDDLINRPVFFGCDAKNLTDLVDYHNNDKINETDIPLIVHIANTKTNYNSNTSTFKMSYDDDEKFGLIQSGFEGATRKNLTDDSNWATCVGCAIIRRSQERLGQDQSDECKKCFEQYCWRGGKKESPASTMVTSSSSSKTSSSSKSSSESSSKSSSTSTSSSTHGGKKSTAAPVSRTSIFFVVTSTFMALGTILIWT